MKEDEKNSLGGLPVAYQSIEFEDKAINELKIISSKKRWQINVRFKSLPSYLRGLTLRYTPNTQLKKFYLKYKYRGKVISLPLGEFIPGYYGVIQVSKEVMRLHEYYYL